MYQYEYSVTDAYEVKRPRKEHARKSHSLDSKMPSIAEDMDSNGKSAYYRFRSLPALTSWILKLDEVGVGSGESEAESHINLQLLNKLPLFSIFSGIKC